MHLEFVLGALAAAACAALLCAPLVRAGLWDHPDAVRKPHATATPSAGGLAAAGGFAAAIAGLAYWPGLRWSDLLEGDALLRTALAVGFAFIALTVGLLDDLRNLNARLKFALLTALSLAVAIFVGHAETLPIAGGTVIEFGWLLGVLGSALWVFTLTNAVNFMDGANGLAMGSMAIGFAGMAALGAVNGAPHVVALSLCAAGGLVGFLVWNFPAGRVFAGDAGALFAGTLAAACGLLLVRDGGVSPVIPPLLFFPILADVLLTLAYRLRRGRRLLEAHREHLFQIGLRNNLTHARVAVIYWIVTAHCAALAFVVSFGPRIAPPSLFAPHPGDVDQTQLAMAQAAGWVAALAPIIALAVLAQVSLHVSSRIRRFAEARGLDTP